MKTNILLYYTTLYIGLMSSAVIAGTIVRVLA